MNPTGRLDLWLNSTCPCLQKPLGQVSPVDGAFSSSLWSCAHHPPRSQAPRTSQEATMKWSQGWSPRLLAEPAGGGAVGMLGFVPEWMVARNYCWTHRCGGHLWRVGVSFGAPNSALGNPVPSRHVLTSKKRCSHLQAIDIKLKSFCSFVTKGISGQTSSPQVAQIPEKTSGLCTDSVERLDMKMKCLKRFF